MPRITRWFPVSHDINSDPEVWELTETYGGWMLRVWLQMLSIADRNEGEIKGERKWIEHQMGTLWGSNSRRYNSEWRANQVRMAFDWMANKKWITIERDLIRVANYAKYHITRDANKTPRGNGLASLPSEPSETNKPKPPISPLRGFDDFWFLYPKKVSKKDAQKAWKKIKFDNGTLGHILDALRKQKEQPSWIKDDGQYVPNPSTWLNQERWHDEIKPASHSAEEEEIERLWGRELVMPKTEGN